MDVSKLTKLKGVDLLNKYRRNYNLSSLDEEQRKKWLLDNKKRLSGLNAPTATSYLKLANLVYLDDAFKNATFGNKSGKELFDRFSKEQRGFLLNNKAIDDAFLEYYGKDSNFLALLTLTPSGKESLLKSGYKNEETLALEKKERETKKTKFEQEHPWLNRLAAAQDPHDASSNPAETFTERYSKGEETYTKTLADLRLDLLNKVVADDNRYKQQIALPYANLIMREWQDGINNNKTIISPDGKLVSYTKYINDLFEKYIGGSTEEVDKGVGKLKEVHPGSRWYRAYKDSPEMENLTLSEKMNILSKYQAVTEQFSEYDAVNALDTELLDYVDNNRTGLRLSLYVTKNVVSGGVANIANKAMGMEALWIAITLGKDGLANFLLGKDELGNERSLWNNPLYWKGVDDYNTFDINEIKRAQENGGISPYLITTKFGEEYSSSRTVQEAVKMSKFLWSDALVALLTRSLGKGITRLAGGVFENGVLNSELSSTLSKVVNFAAAGIEVGSTGVGISESYGLQTFDQNLADNNALIDKKVDEVAERKAEEQLESVLSQQIIENFVAAQKEKLRLAAIESAANGGSPLNIPTDEELRSYGRNLLKQKLMLDYRDSDEAKEAFKEDRQRAAEDAASSYMMDASIEEARMALGNLAFKKYLFGKNTLLALGDRNPVLASVEENAEGLLETTISKGWNVAKRVLTPVWDGFLSNYLDDVTVGFGKGFGYGKFNNYLEQKYSPEAGLGGNSEYTSEFLLGLNYAARGAKEAATSFLSFYDGFVGALGSVTSVGVKLTSDSRNEAREMMGLEEGEKGTLMLRLNTYITNPLLDGYYRGQKEYSDAQAFVKVANEEIEKHKGAAQDISDLLTTFKSQETSTAPGKTRYDAEAAKLNNLFKLASLVNAWRDDPVMRASSKVQEAINIVDGIVNGTMEQSKMDELVTLFLGLPSNKSVASKENAREEAAETIKLNAEAFNNMLKSIERATKQVNSSSSNRHLSREHRGALIYSLAMDDTFKDSQKSLEKEITGTEAINTDRNAYADYGTRGAWERAKAVLEKEVEDTTKEVASLQEKLESEKKAKETSKNKEERREHDKKAESYRLLLETAEERKADAEAKLKQINKDESLFKDADGNNRDSHDTVLTSDEILLLSPEQRAKMLSLSHINEYTIALLAEILKARIELAMLNQELLSAVLLSAAVTNAIKDNMKAFDKLSNEKNALAASYYIESLEHARVAAAERIGKSMMLNSVDLLLMEAEAQDKADGTTSLGTQIRAAAIKLGYEALQDYITARKEQLMEEQNVDKIDDVAVPESLTHLEEISKIVKLLDDAQKAIDALFTEDNQAGVKANLSRAIYGATFDKNSVEEAMSALEDAIDYQTDDRAKRQLEAVLNRMQELSYLRDATKVTKRKEIAARKQAEALRVAEEKAKVEKESQLPSSNTELLVASEGALKAASKKYSVNSEIKMTGEQANSLLGTSFTKYASEEFVLEELSKKAQSTADYLNGDITAELYVKERLGMNFSEAPTLDKLKSIADREANKYKSLLKENKLESLENTEGTDISAKNLADENSISVEEGENFSTTGNPNEALLIGVGEEVNLVETPLGLTIASPSLELLAKLEGTHIEKIPSVDTTDLGNVADNNSPNLSPGNYLIGLQYNTLKLASLGVLERVSSLTKEERKLGKDPLADLRELFLDWLDENNIKLLDIIDNELLRIIEEIPGTHILFMRMNSSPRNMFKDTIIQVIEYTKEVAKYHNEDLGGVITSNGKEYLVVGVFGYTNVAQRDSFNTVRKGIEKAKNAFFLAHPEEEYYVDPVFYTDFHSGTAGYIVRQLESDSEVQTRRVGDLADGKVGERNPEGLSIDELAWGILKGENFFTIGVSDKTKVYPPRDKSGNSGNTFLLVRAANGYYVPVYLKPVMYNELVEGSTLKTKIEGLFNLMLSPDFNTRLKAKQELVLYLNLDEKTNILIGDLLHPTITIILNGQMTNTFALGATFNRAEFSLALANSRFRVNITVSTLTNAVTLNEYNEAGALLTDAAKLGTSNMVYSVYPCDNTGKPIVAKDESWSTLTGSRPFTSPKVTHSVLYKGQVYREREGVFYDSNNKPVDSKSSIAELLYWNLLIKENNLTPAINSKGADYFVIRNSLENPLVIKRKEDGVIEIADKEKSRATIEYLLRKAEERARAKAAEAAIEVEDVQTSNNIPSRESLVPQLLPEEASVGVTDELLTELYLGMDKSKEEVVFDNTEKGKEEKTPEAPVVAPPKRDVNDVSNGLLKPLVDSSKITTFAEAYKSREHRDRMNALFLRKGWDMKGSIKQKIAALEGKGISTTFSDFEDFMQLLEECF